MSNNRISVTWLDSYQYFLDSEMTEDELYERFYGAFTQNPAMAAGTAWHKVLEDNAISLYEIKEGGFSFDISGLVRKAENLTVNIGEPHERENKHVMQLIDGVDLVGKIDVETPYTVYDHKLTGSYKPERYFDAWQWRAYLTMRNKDQFTYQIFECKPVREYGQTVEIKDYHSLDMYAYEGMQDEVKAILTDLNNLINKWRSEGKPCKRDYSKQEGIS